MLFTATAWPWGVEASPSWVRAVSWLRGSAVGTRRSQARTPSPMGAAFAVLMAIMATTPGFLALTSSCLPASVAAWPMRASTEA